jgi:hypothetical protein
MSIWTKILAGVVLLGLIGAGIAFWMDLYGVRRGCFATGLDQAQYQSARDLYVRANRAVAARNFIAASDLLDMALIRLGDSYRLGRAADDTGEVVFAAKAAAARTEFEIAARLKLEVMNRRLYQFQRKTRLSGLCRDVARRWHLE